LKLFDVIGNNSGFFRGWRHEQLKRILKNAEALDANGVRGFDGEEVAVVLTPMGTETFVRC